MNSLSTKIVTENGVFVMCPPKKREKNLKDTLKAEIMAEIKEELKKEFVEQNPVVDKQQG